MAQRSKFLESLKKNIINQKEVNYPPIADSEVKSMEILHENNSQYVISQNLGLQDDLQKKTENPLDSSQETNENSDLQQQCIVQEINTSDMQQLQKIHSSASRDSNSTSSSSSSSSSGKGYSSDDSVADPNFNISKDFNLSQSDSDSEPSQAENTSVQLIQTVELQTEQVSPKKNPRKRLAKPNKMENKLIKTIEACR
ncbi:unnamed protein product [Parnassius apollo]|uniref:(apollo) hypothetical protein n=1 Tax=Parnassius apollo TaxID=110799 RepID=A0A8S3XY33_PARAO|nr:unnamed protein product [Parnassius apollo]